MTKDTVGLKTVCGDSYVSSAIFYTTDRAAAFDNGSCYNNSGLI